MGGKATRVCLLLLFSLLMRNNGPSILVNLKQQTMYHFIAWDGNRLHDQSYVSIVNTRDRSNQEESNKVFEELYNKNKIVLADLQGV